jgi:hypothetical protein
MAIVGAESGPEETGGADGGAAGIPRNAGAAPAGGRAGSGDGMAAEGTGGGGIPAAGGRSAGHARGPGDGDETATVASDSERSSESRTSVGAESTSSSRLLGGSLLGSSFLGDGRAIVGAESGAVLSTFFATHGPVGRSLMRPSSLGGGGGNRMGDRSVGGLARSDTSGALSRAGGGGSRSLTRSASASSIAKISSSFTEITSSSSGGGVGNEMGASGGGVR